MISKTAFLEYCMPAAVLNFVIAKEFGFDSSIVSQAIVFTTLALIPLAFLFDRAMLSFL
ncbi:MAG: hypothetical protein HY746_08420 [Elusimicrobia bacterium]|nr:hypothetical protein [Elusimicrobiota bacterium]